MPRFQRSETTARVIAFLSSLSKGMLVPYKELSRVVGATIHSRSAKLRSARDILRREHAAVWVPERPHVGLRRLTDTEIAERLPRWWMRGARGKLKRGGHEAEVVETAALDINQQARFGVDSLQRHLAEETLSRTARRRLERVARGNQANDLPSFSIVEWMTSLTPRRRRR